MFDRVATAVFIGVLTLASANAFAIEKITIGNTTIIVKTVMGTLEGDLRHLELKDDIYHNELIETGEQSATELIFLDETKLTVGANSRLTLDRFVYHSDPSRASFVLTATAGVFRFASGKLPKKAYVIHTPTTTIGMRGTIVAIVVLPLYGAGGNGDLAVNVTVESGAAEVTNCWGEKVALDYSGASTTIIGQPGGACSAPTQPGPQPSEFATQVAHMDLITREGPHAASE